MKRIFYVIPIVIGLFFISCSLYWPDMMSEGYSEYRVIFQVTPDDAHVLVNGRFIGEAYEFSTYESALKLISRDEEIVLRKMGYVEEVIDLFEFSSRVITIRRALVLDNEALATEETAPMPEKPAAPPAARYESKKLPAKEAPADLSETRSDASPTTQIILKVQPEEAAIYLDGKFWGISPPGGTIENLHLVTGTYVIDVIKPGYVSQRKAFEITEEKKLEIAINLKKAPADKLIL